MEAWCRIQFADRYAQPLSSRAKLYLNGELVTDPVIPDGVTSIGSYAFCGSDSLRSVTIPSSVTSIGREAFFDCSALTNIALPDSVESIGVSAFSGCVGLTGMTLPDSVTNIGSEAFYNCSALKSVTIPKSVTGIGERAFGWLLRKEEYYVGPGPLVGFTVYGYNNTAAQSYACESKLSFVSLDVLETGFTDVRVGAFYADAVVWAVAHDPQVTEGTDETHFSPSKPCTRGQVVTFLWRAAGCPEPKNTTHPFTDVKESAFYYKAMLWAVENGNTTGADKTHFAPGKTCTRGQVVTFLWRAKGSPEPSGSVLPFDDVKENDFFCKAVLWAAENNVTNGTSYISFSPKQTCTRGQVMTFLYRVFNDK